MENKSNPAFQLAGTQWNFSQLDETPVTGTMRPVFLLFDAEKNSVSGYSGCNRMMGPYKLDNGKLTVGPLATTRMACDEPSMKIEDRLLKVLQEVDGYEIRGDQLLLKQGSQVRASLKAEKK